MVRMRHIFTREDVREFTGGDSGSERDQFRCTRTTTGQLSYSYRVCRPFSFGCALTYTGCYLSAPLFYYLSAAQVIT